MTPKYLAVAKAFKAALKDGRVRTVYHDGNTWVATTRKKHEILERLLIGADSYSIISGGVADWHKGESPAQLLGTLL